jgi:iron(III) transport system substrate-binding protein
MVATVLRVLAAAVVALVAAAASGSAEEAREKEWKDTIAAAKGQTLALSVHAADGFAQTVRVFQKRFPEINVEMTEIIPDAMVTRVLTEQKNGVFAWDSMWASTSNMNSLLIPAGAYQDLEPFLILPEVKDPANWRAPDYRWTSDRAHQVFIHTLYATTLTYQNVENSDGVTITKPEDLLNPKLKGKIGIRDPYHTNGGTWTFGSLYKQMGPEFLVKFFRDTDLVLNMNPRQNADAIMRGDLAVGTGITTDVIARCKLAGGCDAVRPLPFGYVVGPRGVAVFKNAPHPAAAKVWVNWLLSKEGQQAHVTEYAKVNDAGAVSLRKDVDPPNAQQAATTPDYANLDKAFIPGVDSGDAVLSAAMKLYIDVKGGPR